MSVISVLDGNDETVYSMREFHDLLIDLGPGDATREGQASRLCSGGRLVLPDGRTARLVACRWDYEMLVNGALPAGAGWG